MVKRARERIRECAQAGRVDRIFEASYGLPASVDAHETSTGTNVEPAQNMEKGYPAEDGALRITARKGGGIY